jgi:penicillin-insensitive murein DD-endopeptidase
MNFQMMKSSLFPFVALTSVLLGACLPCAGVMSGTSGSIGRVSWGLLRNAKELSVEGDGFELYRKGPRRYGVPELNSLIRRAAKYVTHTHPGSNLLVGELSAASGGFVGGHRSHRSGRDVDLAFYAVDSAGRPVTGTHVVHFDRFGVGLRDGRPVGFDAARNWSLVEALLTDDEARVQWIFVSKGLGALLIQWALDHNRDVEIIKRAASVLHQPSDSAPHDDHFHVRIYCPTNAGAPYCVDTGPVWPWIEQARQQIGRASCRERV